MAEQSAALVDSNEKNVVIAVGNQLACALRADRGDRQRGHRQVGEDAARRIGAKRTGTERREIEPRDRTSDHFPPDCEAIARRQEIGRESKRLALRIDGRV